MNYYTSAGISNSKLTEFKNQIEGLTPNYGDGLRMGTLHDALITEPDKLDRMSNMIDDYSYSFDEIKKFEEMRDVFMRNPICAKLHSQAEFQKVSRKEADFQGVIDFSMLCRCKWDFWFGTWGADLKSTDCKTKKQFEDACEHFDYDRGRYFYMNIEQTSNDMLIGQSKHYPYEIFIIPIVRGDKLYNRGREKTNELALKYYLYMY
jgi:hypothetical protein